MDHETLAALDAWLQDEPEPLEFLYCPQWHEHPEWLDGQPCPCPCHETDAARAAERLTSYPFGRLPRGVG